MDVVRSFCARLLLIVGACAVMLASGPRAEGQDGDASARAAPASPMQQGRFRFKDADYFRHPAAAMASGVATLKKEGFRGLALDAPTSVSVAEQDRCPVVLADIDRARTLVAAPLEKHGLLIATELWRHRTFVAPVVQPRNPLADGRPLGQPSATQISARSYEIDLRERLGLPWETGELRVQVVNGDRISNQVGIALRTGKKGGPPATSPAPVLPEPKGALPSFEKTSLSPAPPSQPGLRIALGAPQAQGASLPVFGAFLVPRSAVQIASAEQKKSNRSPMPFGIVTIALVVTGGESPAPEKLDMNVPLFLTAAESPQQDRFTGYFAVDLASHVRAVDRSQPLYLYAFCDELRTGPIPIALAK
jgi:hypothetical protein